MCTTAALINPNQNQPRHPRIKKIHLGLSQQKEGLDYVLCRKMGRKEITVLSGIDKTQKDKYSMFLSVIKNKITWHENRSEAGAERKGSKGKRAAEAREGNRTVQR